MNDIKLIPDEIAFESLSYELISRDEASYLRSILHIIRMIEISYNELCKHLLDTETPQYAELKMVYAWALVDNFDRLKKILNTPRGIRKKEPWLRIFINKLEQKGALKNIRDSFQHIDDNRKKGDQNFSGRRIDRLIDKEMPLIGCLSYWRKLSDWSGSPYFFNPTNMARAKAIKYSSKESEYEKRWFIYEVDYIKLHFLEDQSIDLSELFFSTQSFFENLDQFIRRNYLEKLR